MGFSAGENDAPFPPNRDRRVIQVEAKARLTTVSKNLVREHLRHIAMMFSQGDFSNSYVGS